MDLEKVDEATASTTAASEADLLGITGRSIALVGNAAAILTHDKGAEIESRDVVMRMNRGVPTRPSSQGHRTDILAFSVYSWVSSVIPQFNTNRYVWMSPKNRDPVHDHANFNGSLHYFDLGRWDALYARLGARPSVGAMCLDLLSVSSPAMVSVYGFDFKKTGTFYEERNHIGPHDYASEERFCATLIDQLGWKFVQC